MRSDGERAEAIFSAALALPVEQRAGWLQYSCAADDALRQRVEKLLTAYEQAGSFLDKPPQSAAEPVDTDQLYANSLDAETSSAADDVGARIGPYKLLQKIGHGGMGVVYLA